MVQCIKWANYNEVSTRIAAFQLLVLLGFKLQTISYLSGYDQKNYFRQAGAPSSYASYCYRHLPHHGFGFHRATMGSWVEGQYPGQAFEI